MCYSKTCLKWPFSKIVFQDQLLLNAGQKYCRMLQGEHSAILSTFIILPIVIKIFVLPIFEWPFYTGFTVFGKLFLSKWIKKLRNIFSRLVLSIHGIHVSLNLNTSKLQQICFIYRYNK